MVRTGWDAAVIRGSTLLIKYVYIVNVMERIGIGNAELGVFRIPLEPVGWPETLSRSEREVVRGLIRNHTHREVACIRGVSEATVHQQVRNVLTKIGVGSTAELVAHMARACSAGLKSESRGSQ